MKTEQKIEATKENGTRLATHEDLRRMATHSSAPRHSVGDGPTPAPQTLRARGSQGAPTQHPQAPSATAAANIHLRAVIQTPQERVHIAIQRRDTESIAVRMRGHGYLLDMRAHGGK